MNSLLSLKLGSLEAVKVLHYPSDLLIRVRTLSSLSVASRITNSVRRSRAWLVRAASDPGPATASGCGHTLSSRVQSSARGQAQAEPVARPQRSVGRCSWHGESVTRETASSDRSSFLLHQILTPASPPGA